MKIYIREARFSDLEKMSAIVQQARAYLAQQGSPQWQGGYGPDQRQLQEDIEQGESYVLIVDGAVAGVAALSAGIDEAYTAITEGHWCQGPVSEYLSLHRIALDLSIRGQGLAKLFLQLLITVARIKGYQDLRIDTYPKNHLMEKTIFAAGFEYRGMITFAIPHGERKAYQLLLD